VRVESGGEGRAASRAQLWRGDLIVGFDGRAVNGIDDLHRVLTAERIGAASRMTVIRGTQKPEKIELRYPAAEAARPVLASARPRRRAAPSARIRARQLAADRLQLFLSST